MEHKQYFSCLTMSWKKIVFLGPKSYTIHSSAQSQKNVIERFIHNLKIFTTWYLQDLRSMEEISHTAPTWVSRYVSSFETGVLCCFDLVMSRLLCPGVSGCSSVMLACVGLRSRKTSLEVTLCIYRTEAKWNDRNIFLRKF